MIEQLRELSDALNLEADIEKRIQRIHGSKKHIPGSARIYHDLQLAGDDAVELLEEISKTYEVSFRGFHFDDYFPNEAEHLWFVWKAWFGFPDTKRKPLTFDHLIEVVRRGSWFAPVGGGCTLA